MKNLTAMLKAWFPAEEAQAHCDGPCGVYDPAAARINAEAVLSMTKKILALKAPSGDDAQAMAEYHNTMARFIAIKEEQAEKAKEEILILWTDFFKPQHLEDYPDLHETFWNAAKLCSTTKQGVDEGKANELMDAVEKIHNMFWSAKGRDVPYYTAS